MPSFGHVEKGSTLQIPEQPSPGRLLPSSQASFAWLILPSPQPGAAVTWQSGGAFAASHGFMYTMSICPPRRPVAPEAWPPEFLTPPDADPPVLVVCEPVPLPALQAET